MFTTSRRRGAHWRILASVILSVVCYACNDTDDVHVGLRTGGFDCSSGFNAVNRVALNCGGPVGLDQFDIVLTIGGATMSKTIQGLHFDVVYPRDRFSFVAGSASIVSNNFLTYGDGVCDTTPGILKCTAGNVGANCTTNGACNLPGVVTPVLTASESLDPPANPTTMPNIVNGRLSIAIDRPMAAGGVGWNAGGPNQVLRFQLQATSLIDPTDPTPLKFQNKMAVNPTGGNIDSVVFNDQIMLWVQ